MQLEVVSEGQAHDEETPSLNYSTVTDVEFLYLPCNTGSYSAVM